MTRRGRSSKPSSNKRLVLHRGEEGRSRAEREVELGKQRAAQRGKGKVFRFYVPVGETKQFAILDEEPDVHMYEHTIPDPQTGKWNLNVGCVGENDSCALCDEYGISSYVLFLTVLDFSEFKDKKGKTHKFSRKLMAVKPSQQSKFTRFFNREGTLRGAVFDTTRDGPKDAAIGNDIEFVEWMTDEELENDYIRKWKDREGKEHEENQADPFNYEEILEAPDADALRAMTGAAPPLGSKAQRDEDDNYDDDDWDDEDEDEKSWDEDDNDDSEEEDAPKSRRSKRGGHSRGNSDKPSKKSSASNTRSRRSNGDDDDEIETEAEAEEKPSRRRSSSTRSRRKSRS